MKRSCTRVQFNFTQKSKTIQSEKDACDVNSILEKYRKTGQISHLKNNPPQYGDFSQAQDFQSSLNTVIAAENAFMSLSAVIRKKFENNPHEYIKFISDEKNYDEAKKLGILSPELVAKRETTNQTTKREMPTKPNGDEKTPQEASNQKPASTP